MIAEDTRITGGCQCGAVRYAVQGPLGTACLCHCRMCQKAFGSFYAPLVGAPLSAFTLTRGTISIFKSSEAVERGFCSDCGTPLSFRHVEDDSIYLAIGSLDDLSIARPTAQYGLEARLPWLGELDALPGETTEASERPARLDLIRRTNHQHPDHDTQSWPAQERRHA